MKKCAVAILLAALALGNACSRSEWELERKRVLHNAGTSAEQALRIMDEVMADDPDWTAINKRFEAAIRPHVRALGQAVSSELAPALAGDISACIYSQPCPTASTRFVINLQRVFLEHIRNNLALTVDGEVGLGRLEAVQSQFAVFRPAAAGLGANICPQGQPDCALREYERIQRLIQSMIQLERERVDEFRRRTDDEFTAEGPAVRLGLTLAEARGLIDEINDFCFRLYGSAMLGAARELAAANRRGADMEQLFHHREIMAAYFSVLSTDVARIMKPAPQPEQAEPPPDGDPDSEARPEYPTTIAGRISLLLADAPKMIDGAEVEGLLRLAVDPFQDENR